MSYPQRRAGVRESLTTRRGAPESTFANSLPRIGCSSSSREFREIDFRTAFGRESVTQSLSQWQHTGAGQKRVAEWPVSLSS